MSGLSEKIKAAHDGSDVRARDRDQRRDGGERADHGGVGEAENEHPYRAERAEDDRFDALPYDVAAEAVVEHARDMLDLRIDLVVQVSAHDAVELRREFFPRVPQPL